MNCSFSQSVIWATALPTSTVATAARRQHEILMLLSRGKRSSPFQTLKRPFAKRTYVAIKELTFTLFENIVKCSEVNIS